MNPNPILVVEDNPDDVDLMVRALGKSALLNELVIAHDGVEAVELLMPTDGRPALEPALVLLDINLPRMDGIEVLRRVRSDPRHRLLPVVVLTTSTHERDLIRSYELGANSFVSKPVDFNEFIEAISVLGVYWLVLNKQP